MKSNAATLPNIKRWMVGIVYKQKKLTSNEAHSLFAKKRERYYRKSCLTSGDN
jgi:hypothetical protein